MNKPVRLVLPEQTDFRARFTAAEFVRMGQKGAFDDMKVELIGGEIERMNPPMSTHGRLQGEIVFALRTALGQRRDMMVFGEVGVELAPDTLVGCDAALARAFTGEDRLLTSEDLSLVVEIAQTTLARDMGAKRTAYALAGIANYWVVDGERRVVHLFADPVAGDYAAITSVRFGDPISLPGGLGSIVLD